MARSFTEDDVRIKLDGHEVPIVKDYRVNSGIMDVPAKFTARVGHGGIFRELASAFPPETPFELLVGDVLVHTGEIDSIDAIQTATEAQLGGRDLLRRLYAADIESDRTFSEKTYADLVEIALEEAGLGDRTLFALNSANRKAITGTQSIQVLTEPATEGTETQQGAASDSSKTIYRSIRADAGTSWLEFVTQQNRRAGLFLWATGDGNFVLSRPNGNQSPIYRIIRRRNGDPGEVSVLGEAQFRHDTTQRFSECVVLGRNGGGKHGRAQFLGRFIDDEMVAILNPNPADRADGGKRKKRKVLKDDKVRSTLQANLLARRRIAESRRAGWTLSYTVAGHTAPALRGGGRAVWTPDTVVQIDDEELGIEGPMYVESVEFQRKPETLTTLKLMRIEDLVFAEEAEEQPKKALATKPGVVPDPDPTVSVTRGSNFWQVDPNPKK